MDGVEPPRRRTSSLRRLGLLLSLGAVLGYGLLLAVIATQYRRFLYPAPHATPDALPTAARLVEAPATDGATVRALFFPPPAQAAVVVHFHGNGETIFDDVWVADELVRRGLGVLLVEYRGYGRSSDEPAPSEAGLYADAAGAIDWLETQGIGGDRVVLWGQSLGSGVAAEMSLRGRASALVLVSPYTSIVDMARRHAPSFVPVSLVVGDHYDTLSKAPRIAVPTLVVHGDADELIPYAMGAKLASTLPHATLRTVRGGHHNDLLTRDADGIFDAVAALAGERRR